MAVAGKVSLILVQGLTLCLNAIGAGESSDMMFLTQPAPEDAIDFGSAVQPISIRGDFAKLGPSSGGTDKILDHGYHRFYPLLLERFRTTAPLRLLEIGAQIGGSLSLWADYFPHAELFTVEIDPPRELLKEIHRLQVNGRPRWKLFHGDATDPKFINDVLQAILSHVASQGYHGVRERCAGLSTSNPAPQCDLIHVIIDDGSHHPAHQKTSFQYFFPAIAPGGVYFVEDLETSYWSSGFAGDLPIQSSRDDPGSAINYFRDLVHWLNRLYDEQRSGKRKASSLAESVGTITFGQNIVAVTKQLAEHNTYAQKKYARAHQWSSDVQKKQKFCNQHGSMMPYDAIQCAGICWHLRSRPSQTQLTLHGLQVSTLRCKVRLGSWLFGDFVINGESCFALLFFACSNCLLSSRFVVAASGRMLMSNEIALQNQTICPLETPEKDILRLANWVLCAVQSHFIIHHKDASRPAFVAHADGRFLPFNRPEDGGTIPASACENRASDGFDSASLLLGEWAFCTIEPFASSGSVPLEESFLVVGNMVTQQSLFAFRGDGSMMIPHA